MDANKEFKHEVAISFLSDDETIACQIQTFLNGVKVYVYSREQESLASKAGDEELRNVFKNDSRIVVVLYREQWGSTKFTFVEEEAIKERRFEDMSNDFLIMVNMTGKEKMPKWLPSRIIWVDYAKFGLNGLAAIIQHKIMERGGISRVETSKEIAERKTKEIEFNRKRILFLESEKGLVIATEQFKLLCQLIEKKVNENNGTLINFKFEPVAHEEIRVKGHSLILNVCWNHFAVNNLIAYDDYFAYLLVRLRRSSVNILDRFYKQGIRGIIK